MDMISELYSLILRATVPQRGCAGAGSGGSAEASTSTVSVSKQRFQATDQSINVWESNLPAESAHSFPGAVSPGAAARACSFSRFHHSCGRNLCVIILYN
jgi:hypothetical protein